MVVGNEKLVQLVTLVVPLLFFHEYSGRREVVEAMDSRTQQLSNATNPSPRPRTASAFHVCQELLRSRVRPVPLARTLRGQRAHMSHRPVPILRGCTSR